MARDTDDIRRDPDGRFAEDPKFGGTNDLDISDWDYMGDNGLGTPDKAQRLYVAAKESETRTEQISFAANDDPEVRRALALNNHLHPEIRDRLARDLSTDVRTAIAGREDLPESTVRELARDKDARVRYQVAYRRNLPKDVSKALRTDDSAQVRDAVRHAESMRRPWMLRRIFGRG